MQANDGAKAPLKMRIAAKWDNFKWLGHKLINNYDIIDIGLGAYNMSSSVFLEKTMIFFWKYGNNIFSYGR